MSDELLLTGESATETEKPVPAVTAGSLIRQAREAMGLHIAALAVSLKVPVKKLEALEADRLHDQQDIVFVRALASSVCRSLRLDAATILEKLPQPTKPELRPEVNINAPFHESGSVPVNSVSSFLARPLVVAVGALLCAAVVVAVWPELQKWVSVADVKAVSQPDVQPTPTTVFSTPTEVTATVSVALPVSSVALSATTEAVLDNSRTNAATAVASGPEMLLSAPSTLLFTARAPTWVEVVERSGAVTLKKLLAPGELASAGGSLPLSVVVGRADGVDVQVRGKPFSLEAVTKANVARFEVR